MRVGKWHILGPKSHVSIASLVERILAVAMEIWNYECGPFWPHFAVFAIVCHIGITISPWGTGLKVLPWVVEGAGGLGAGKTSGAGTRGVSLDVVIGGRTGHSDTNGGESSNN